jgi:hypothetical protein
MFPKSSRICLRIADLPNSGEKDQGETKKKTKRKNPGV